MPCGVNRSGKRIVWRPSERVSFNSIHENIFQFDKQRRYKSDLNVFVRWSTPIVVDSLNLFSYLVPWRF